METTDHPRQYVMYLTVMMMVMDSILIAPVEQGTAFLCEQSSLAITFSTAIIITLPQRKGPIHR